ncbi:MAG: ComF family protein [Dehalococcoidales bacterium]|nr:ComF family protein [Dehalococcoidales bacterium]
MNIFSQLADLKGIVVDLLFPVWCVCCGKKGSYICPSCYSLFVQLLPPLCPKCGRPQPDNIICTRCINEQAEINGIRSPFQFEGLLRQAIHQLKYRNLRALATPMARFLHEFLINNPLPGDTLVPVPLHQKRIRERGYNQSNLLARELGKLTNLPVISDCLIRKRYAPSQAKTATANQRYSNVADAFYCQDNRLKDKQILLIDDVSTSGATLNACAAALKAAGVTTVWGLVLAREI